MRFLRSKRLRTALYLAHDGKCAECGANLTDGWHADHIIPWSVSHDTNVHDMQALCASCNLKKGAKMVGRKHQSELRAFLQPSGVHLGLPKMTDRKHQSELREALSRTDAGDLPLKVLMWVVAGGGKSRIPGIAAQRFPKHKVGWFVPRLTLQSQAVEGMAKDFNIVLRDSGNDTDPSRGTRGFVATHAALMERPDLWRDEFRRHPYLLVVDEHHHAKIDRDGTPRPLSTALTLLKADVSLYMTGTLETSDNTLIHGAEYDAVEGGSIINPQNSADIYIRYDRKTALREGAIVPMEFQHHDGPVAWKKPEGGDAEVRLSAASREDEGAALYTALRTDVAIQLFESGLAHWRRHAAGGKLIVVTDRQQIAREYEKLLTKANVRSALAITDNPEAHAQVKRFRNDPTVPALVTCQMAYEGLDVPATSHIICLTHIRSAPWIEQMLARAWRATGRKRRCWAFVPDDPRMNRVIAKIAEEQLAVVPDYEEGPPPPGGEREPVLALNGNVDLIHQKYLDEAFAGDCGSVVTDRLLEFVREFGLSGNEPEVQALLARISQPRPASTQAATVKEQETRLRNQIAEECRSIDGLRARRSNAEPAFGETQRQLVYLTGKSIKDMSIEELKGAHSKLQSLRS